MTQRSVDFPLFLVAAILCLVVGGMHLAQVVAQADLYPAPKWHKFSLGLDYRVFYNASLHMRAGESPYIVEAYVNPPLPAIANIPLSFLRQTEATLIAAGLTFFSVLASYLLVRRIFSPANVMHDLQYLLGTLIVICFSYPFLFLFDRENIDGFVLVSLCMGVYFAGKRDLLAGMLIGISIALKVYPTLVIIPLVANRRWRLLGWVGLCLFLLFLATPHLWIEWLSQRVWIRTGDFRASENGSIISIFHCFGWLFNLVLLGHLDPASGSYVPWFEKIGAGLYLLMLATVAYVDFRDRHPEDRNEFALAILTYFPFMVAMPKLAYHYELVFIPALIPALCWLWGNATQRGQKRILLFVTIGVAVTQFQAVAADRLMSTFLPHSIPYLLHFIPGFGLLMVLLGITLFKVQRFGATKPMQTETAVALAESQ